MKFPKWSSAGFCFAVALSSPVAASVIAFDNFDYADGSLVPNGGWTGHSGTAGTLLVASNRAVLQHGVPSEDAHLPFSAISGSIFYGLDFTVNASGQIVGTDNEYFAHFRNGFDFSARLDVVQALGGGDYSVGIASDDSVADAIWATDLVFGTTYRAVVGYNQDSNIAQLWIDATTSADASILGDDRPDPGDSVNSFALRQSDSTLNETVYVDNLVIGMSFEDVVVPVTTSGPGPSIPEPATLALFGLGAAGLSFARRKKA